MKILMVCLGNICRSPLAEGILRHKVRQKGYDWTIDSAGTGFWHVGEQPDTRSIAVAKRYGIDISSQRARRFRAEDLEEFDLIFAMDRSNYQDILRLAQSEEEENKVELILNLSSPGKDREVPDPYWDDDGFERVYRLLEEACTKLLERYIDLNLIKT